MTLRHMRIFVSVFENGSVTGASRELHLAQPSVSLALRELEEYYGVCLFERIGRKICPTDCGREFYEYAAHVDGLFGEMERRVRNWDAIGTLRIGSSIAIGTHILPGMVRRMQREHPGLTIRVFVGSSCSVEEDIEKNKVDLGLIENSPERKGIQAEPFRKDELCAIAPPGHPLGEMEAIPLAELARYPLLMREKGSAGRDIMDAYFDLRGIRVEPLWESTSSQAIVQAVAEGIGVAMLPFSMVREDMEKGRVIRLSMRRPIYRSMNLVWHRSKYLTGNMKAFMEIVRGWEENGPEM